MVVVVVAELRVVVSLPGPARAEPWTSAWPLPAVAALVVEGQQGVAAAPASRGRGGAWRGGQHGAYLGGVTLLLRLLLVCV